MDNIEDKQNIPLETAPKSKIEIFRDEIKRIKETEMAKKKAWQERGMEGEAYNPHFDVINPEYLGEAEREVYKKYQEDNLSADEFRSLRDLANKDYETLPPDAKIKKEALNYFWAYMGNLVNVRETRRQLNSLKITMKRKK